MKFLVLILTMMLSVAWAEDKKSPAYPVKNFKFITDQEFEEVVIRSTQKIMVVFSDGTCLWNSLPMRTCFTFERKLDAEVATLSKRGWKIVGFDIGFRHLDYLALYNIKLRPTVVLFERGLQLTRVEPEFFHQESARLILWQEDMINQLHMFTKNYQPTPSSRRRFSN
jgi:hypothetical protein